MLKISTIHIAFGRGCFETVLIENICRTLGIKVSQYFCNYYTRIKDLFNLLEK
jgi:hypothetical protein